MHNIKSIRKDPDYYLRKFTNRNTDINLKNLLNLDKKNRELIQNKEKLAIQSLCQNIVSS